MSIAINQLNASGSNRQFEAKRIKNTPDHFNVIKTTTTQPNCNQWIMTAMYYPRCDCGFIYPCVVV